MSTKLDRSRAVGATSKEMAERHPNVFAIYRWIAMVAEDEKGTPRGSTFRKRAYRQAIADLREDYPDEWEEIYERWLEHFIARR